MGRNKPSKLYDTPLNYPFTQYSCEYYHYSIAEEEDFFTEEYVMSYVNRRDKL